MNEKGKSTLEKYKDFLNLKGYGKNTIGVYYNYTKLFINSFNKPALHLTIKDCENFIYNFPFSSKSQQNQIYSALKSFYRELLGIDLTNKIFFTRPKKDYKLPNIILEELIKNTLPNIKNPKHRAILSLAYSLGLRRGDIQNLKIKNIDSQSMQIKIVEGKGRKDAYLPLTKNILIILRQYCKEYNITNLNKENYLFEGQNKNKYSGTSLNSIVKKYFGKEYHFHNIRHSTATHLLNKSVDISFIQKLLRHKDIKTTMIYLKISTQDLNKLPIY